MEFSFEMTMKELVEEMNSGGTQKDLYKLSKISKDVLPYLFKAAGYTREKQKYVPEANANENITIENLLPAAIEVHMQAKIAKLTNEPAPKVVVLEAEKPTEIPEKQELIQTNVGANVIDFSDKEQMQHAILDVLNLTTADLEAIRSISQPGEPATDPDKGSIFEEIKKLVVGIERTKHIS